MRVLVTGGRNYADRKKVWRVLYGLSAKYGRLTIIQGGATGADEHAREWCYRNYRHPSSNMINEPADWTDLSHPDAVIRTRRDGTKYDALAGLRRNQLMLDKHKPELVIAFPGGTGTADMVRRARKAGIEVREIG